MRSISTFKLATPAAHSIRNAASISSRPWRAVDVERRQWRWPSDLTFSVCKYAIRRSAWKVLANRHAPSTPIRPETPLRTRGTIPTRVTPGISSRRMGPTHLKPVHGSLDQVETILDDYDDILGGDLLQIRSCCIRGYQRGMVRWTSLSGQDDDNHLLTITRGAEQSECILQLSPIDPRYRSWHQQ